MLVDVGCKVTVIASYRRCISNESDGIFLSDGQEILRLAIMLSTTFVILSKTDIPTHFGDCLGHQLLGLASGASYY
jgi:carbamoylphosphate synthase small subunit